MRFDGATNFAAKLFWGFVPLKPSGANVGYYPEGRPSHKPEDICKLGRGGNEN